MHGLLESAIFNGTYGTVVGWDEMQGKYAIQLDQYGTMKNFKPENIT